MSGSERAVVFRCGTDLLIGILHTPLQAATGVGVLVVVGGPQYRVGSHRQFVVLARALADAGYAAFRFDYRGMGDSDSSMRSFEHVDEDIRAAVDAFLAEQPGLASVVLWGLCDAAAAILMYCRDDRRLQGMVLVNPWVRTIRGEARTYLRHYYRQKFVDPVFWRKVFSGAFNPIRSAREIALTLRHARGGVKVSSSTDTFIGRMLAGLQTFNGDVLILISEGDLTAREFVDLCAVDEDWRAASCRHGVSIITVENADHTFSSRASLDRANRECLAWLARACNDGAKSAAVLKRL